VRLVVAFLREATRPARVVDVDHPDPEGHYFIERTARIARDFEPEESEEPEDQRSSLLEQLRADQSLEVEPGRRRHGSCAIVLDRSAPASGS